MKSKPYKDVSLEAYEEWEEEEMILEESEVGKIPFSMFIREMGGVSPSVSRVVGKFSVDVGVEYRFAISSCSGSLSLSFGTPAASNMSMIPILILYEEKLSVFFPMFVWRSSNISLLLRKQILH